MPPSASTARLSSHWKPGSAQTMRPGDNGCSGSTMTPSRESVNSTSFATMQSAMYTRVPSGESPMPFGEISPLRQRMILDPSARA